MTGKRLENRSFGISNAAAAVLTDTILLFFG